MSIWIIRIKGIKDRKEYPEGDILCWSIALMICGASLLYSFYLIFLIMFVKPQIIGLRDMAIFVIFVYMSWRLVLKKSRR